MEQAVGWDRDKWSKLRNEIVKGWKERIAQNNQNSKTSLPSVRTLLGFILFSTSYCVVNGILYYKYVRPLRQEERELLERELIEADKAGFAIK
ncbi:hypothetical protein Tcan_13137 [Toxocara canis]|uniref:Uncharacterized protein n=1 Tax=Toxocara canis TaxID=6265 RepID=A0A0B2W5P2_TOXCA|nr:hypothetical protein Tcan_13137 [Toxocara canis]